MSVADIKIVAPGPGSDEAPSVRFTDSLVVVVDVDLDEPWFAIPHLGRRITGNFDGVPEPAVVFELRHGTSVKALTAGRALVADTGTDDHSGSPMKPVPAGRGCEVTVKSGSFELTYSHLKRGSARNATHVRVGDTVGIAGNSGRCFEGAKGAYLKLSGRSKAVKVRLEDYSDPVTLEATLNEFLLGAPVELGEGELNHRGVKLEPVHVNPDLPERFRRGENDLEVVAKRDARIIGRRKAKITIDF